MTIMQRMCILESISIAHNKVGKTWALGEIRNYERCEKVFASLGDETNRRVAALRVRALRRSCKG